MRRHGKTDGMMSERLSQRRNQAIDSEIAILAELATAKGMDLLGFRREVLQRLAVLIGYDAGSVCRTMEPWREREPVFLSPLQLRDWRQYCENWRRYWAELQLLAHRDCLLGDASMTHPQTARSLTVYEDIIRPSGMKSLLALPVSIRGRQISVVTLLRTPGTSGFASRDADIVRRLRPVLALGENLLNQECLTDTSSRATGGVQRLSPRELEVAQYVALGLTNAQIALVCGKSAATVHNQLISIFRKTGVSSRCELVRLLIDEETTS